MKRGNTEGGTPGEAASLKRRGVGRFWGRGRFSKRSASPPDPLSRRVAGNRLVRSFGLVRPCELGVISCKVVVVTAADRAAATCQRWSTTKLQGERPEGVAGAIGKLPDGLRPPPRVRRREILLVSFRRRRGTIRGANDGRYILLPWQRIPQQKSLSSVSLTADSSLCGGSLLAHFLQSLP